MEKKKKLMHGVNDQETANPAKRVWWRNNKGHIWSSTICDCRRRANCPYCSGGGPVAGAQDQQS